MLRITSFALLLLVSFSGFTQGDYTELSGRGLIKTVYSQQHTAYPEQYQTWISLKGTSERATCPALIFAETDRQGPELVKLALQLNRPVEVRFVISKANPEAREQDPMHCQITHLLLKP
ncbi:hypothetical protein [Planctobacterium marinum]|uniref:Uncharacterized protein n=1 Tax=Planctobacterium marinum TaxID=1631968 RepID=A0AA48KRV8_9ALTE|nr:hypothetical protein MACH26_35040 [Planctobacterium marinum]